MYLDGGLLVDDGDFMSICRWIRVRWCDPDDGATEGGVGVTVTKATSPATFLMYVNVSISKALRFTSLMLSASRRYAMGVDNVGTSSPEADAPSEADPRQSTRQGRRRRRASG